MSSPAQLRPPHARRRHRLTALTATAALSLAGLLAAAAPAMADTAPTVIATVQIGGVLLTVAVTPDGTRAYVTTATTPSA
jgi:DNA-binding beta-propeller fold protein YncE